jgi:hypothetical protein
MSTESEAIIPKRVYVAMEEPFWRLLERYHVMVNARLKERGWKSISLERLVGSILSYFFLAHHEKILEESASVQITEVQRKLLSVMYPGELDALAPDLRAALSELGRGGPPPNVRVSGNPSRGKTRSAAGAVRRAAARTRRDSGE